MRESDSGIPFRLSILPRRRATGDHLRKARRSALEENSFALVLDFESLATAA